MGLLNKSRTSIEDLHKLLTKVGLCQTKIDWAYNFDPDEPRMILNLGNPLLMGGTHWIAVDNEKKRYFDPLGAAPPSFIPRSYDYNGLQVQDFNFGHCGQYSILFLAYSKADEIDRFYNLFEDPNL
jgi:hypothetical protein